MLELTDEEIVSRAQKGNIDLFGEFVRRYEEKLTRYAKRFFFQEDDAKDLLQEIFIKTYVNIQNFDTRERFSPWIYRIAHNEFINAIKKKQLRETISIFDFDVFLPHPMEAIDCARL